MDFKNVRKLHAQACDVEFVVEDDEEEEAGEEKGRVSEGEGFLEVVDTCHLTHDTNFQQTYSHHLSNNFDYLYGDSGKRKDFSLKREEEKQSERSSYR